VDQNRRELSWNGQPGDSTHLVASRDTRAEQTLQQNSRAALRRTKRRKSKTSVANPAGKWDPGHGARAVLTKYRWESDCSRALAEIRPKNCARNKTHAGIGAGRAPKSSSDGKISKQKILAAAALDAGTKTQLKKEKKTRLGLDKRAWPRSKAKNEKQIGIENLDGKTRRDLAHGPENKTEKSKLRAVLDL
jgi:hypothetical protein